VLHAAGTSKNPADLEARLADLDGVDAAKHAPETALLVTQGHERLRKLVYNCNKESGEELKGALFPFFCSTGESCGHAA
jgi:hypothetical protein